jgi:DNA-binding response OmpR family regulator
MGGHVLVAEGSENLRSAHASALSDAGYHVSVAADGFEALEAISRVKPDLILLDLGLRGISGWEILSSLHTITDWCDTDVITISAGRSPSEIAAAWRHGCSWSMTRQIRLKDLLLVVGCLLGARRMRQARRDAPPTQCPRTMPRETPMALAPAP